MKPNKHSTHSHFFTILFIILLLSGHFAKTYGREKTPLNVDAFVVILDISKFNNEKQELNVDFVVHLTWENSKPLHPEGSDTLDANLDYIKKIQVLNEVNLTKKGEIAELLPDGRTSLLVRYVGTVDQNFGFKEFPFDKQVFKINILLPGTKDIRFRLLTDKDKILNRSIPDWNIKNPEMKPLELNVNGRKMVGFTYQIKASRKRGYYFLKVFLPIALIVFMSWSVFWVDPEKIDAQLTVSSTAILSLIAFLFSLTYTVPKISYLTKMDFFLYGSLIFVFLALVESVFTGSMATKGEYELSKKTDRWSRYIFPLSYLIVLLLIYLL